MSTEAQIAANRANAEHSTGPNAIYDATGVRIRRVPFRDARVLAALKAGFHLCAFVFIRGPRPFRFVKNAVSSPKYRIDTPPMTCTIRAS